MSNNFDDIRPYNDAEVRPTIDRLLKDKEFLDAIGRFRFSFLPEIFLPLARPFISTFLNSQSKDIQTVHDFQLKIESYLKRMIDNTITNLSFTGLENLDQDKPYLFISNHRDIAMDPALINWALHQQGFQTLRIAIGDNLLTKPYVSDLMRINKSFIVNRSATAPREKLKAAKNLSAYIHHSITEDKTNIWVAQREGRAKDGLDRTNSAVIGMLTLSKPKKMSLSDYVNELNIVPVSISYEYDPCDEAKAKELHLQKTQGEYEKAEHEDASSIALGITGFKGNVHIHFSETLQGDFQSVDEIVEAIDHSVIENYHLHPSNMVAYRILHGDCDCETLNLPDFHAEALVNHKQTFEKRVADCDKRWREVLLSMYANPVSSQQSLSETQEAN